MSVAESYLLSGRGTSTSREKFHEFPGGERTNFMRRHGFCAFAAISLLSCEFLSAAAAAQSSRFPFRSRKLLQKQEIRDADDDLGDGLILWIFPQPKVGLIHSQCSGARDHEGFQDECAYARANDDECSSQGLIDYLRIFYCYTSGGGAARKAVAIAALSLWLAALFYMLGSTAADYFCTCLEQLAALLKLPPTLAGVTLLPLGNGAPDVFSSLLAFLSGSGAASNGGTLGLTSVLGGALFVVTVVAGLVNILVEQGGHSVALNRRCFLRDGIFFLVSLTALATILWRGGAAIFGAAAYLGIYVIYAVAVASSEMSCCSKTTRREVDETLLPRQESTPQLVPLKEDIPAAATPTLFRRASHLLIEKPLALPRQLTIPIIDETRWCRRTAVAAASLAPLFLVVLWPADWRRSLAWQAAVATMVAILLGLVAAATTTAERPPTATPVRAAWLAAGFAMSIVWFYAIARELVATLAALSAVLGVDQAALGVTILAWGNSVGDLVANSAMARGSASGVQIAMAGCYAGPMFNTLFGLGISFLATAIRSGSGRFHIDGSGTAIQCIVFLVAAIVAALVALPLQGMRPSRGLGATLLLLYAAFLATQSISGLF